MNFCGTTCTWLGQGQFYTVCQLFVIFPPNLKFTVYEDFTLGIVAVGGKVVSRSRSPTTSKKVKVKHAEVDLISDSDSGDDSDDHSNSGGRRKGKQVVATGGEALDRNKELWVN